MKCQPWREVEVENSLRDIVFHRGLILDLCSLQGVLLVRPIGAAPGDWAGCRQS